LNGGDFDGESGHDCGVGRWERCKVFANWRKVGGQQKSPLPKQ
jgi:hypothetical protein